MVATIHADLLEIKMTLQDNRATADTMLEILIAWNQTKGFVKTIQLIAEVAKWLVVVGGTIGAIVYFLRKP